MSSSAKIRIRRVVEPVLVVQEGRGRIEERDEHIGMFITGPDGQQVSLVFDGRADCYYDSGSYSRKEYVTYADNPIRSTHGGCNGPVNDADALRILRDALIAMDLGDFDESVDCTECGDRFVPDNRSHTNYCPDCAAKDYCASCGDYDVLDDSDNCTDCARWAARAAE